MQIWTVTPQTWTATLQTWTTASETITYYYLSEIPEELIIREISLSDLFEAVKADWADIKREIEELLRDYGVSPRYAELVISLTKEEVKERLKGASEDVLEAMTKLYIKLTYMLLKKKEEGKK
jgi:hypothetical protein